MPRRPPPNHGRSSDRPLDYDYRTDVGTHNALRILRANQSLPRPRDVDRSFFRRDGSLDDRVRCPSTVPTSDRLRAFANSGSADGDHAREIFERNLRRRYEMAPHGNVNHAPAFPPAPLAATADPFRHWELNSENNSFRPAHAVRRITDGTLPPNPHRIGYAASAAAAIQIEITNAPQPIPSTSQQAQDRGDAARIIELSPNSSRLDDVDNEKSSPESSQQPRFGEHTEDDQSAANKFSDNTTSSFDDYTSGLNNAHSDDANTDDDDQSSFGPSDDGKDMTDK